MRSVTTEDDELQGLTPAEAFRRAKVEHFLQHARDYIEMGRFLAATKALETVFSLDRGNKDGEEIRASLDESMSRMFNRSKNGNASPKGEDAQPGRVRRVELVMVVDQDERLLASLTSTLRRYGFMAIGASSYDEAVETYSKAKPDVVISEVNFETGPRGFDLYLWLKTNAPQLNHPFLFLATRIDRETLIAGKRFGVDDLIMKPVDDDVVIASVINCLSRRKAQPVHS
jgi:PleD family two-component response regulator